MPNLLDALSDSENTIDLQDENLITPIHEFLEINPEKRLITIPESEQLFGVYGENKVEIKYFKCPRIILNDIDLYECYIFINYISASGKIGYIQADTVVLDETENYIIFTWELTRNVFDENTDADIYFSISAKQYLEDKEPVFFTRKAKGNLYETVYAEEQITEQYADIILQLLAEMDGVKQIATPEAINVQKVDCVVDVESDSIGIIDIGCLPSNFGVGDYIIDSEETIWKITSIDSNAIVKLTTDDISQVTKNTIKIDKLSAMKVDLPKDAEGNLIVPTEGQTLLFKADGTTYYGTPTTGSGGNSGGSDDGNGDDNTGGDSEEIVETKLTATFVGCGTPKVTDGVYTLSGGSTRTTNYIPPSSEVAGNPSGMIDARNSVLKMVFPTTELATGDLQYGIFRSLTGDFEDGTTEVFNVNNTNANDSVWNTGTPSGYSMWNTVTQGSEVTFEKGYYYVIFLHKGTFSSNANIVTYANTILEIYLVSGGNSNGGTPTDVSILSVDNDYAMDYGVSNLSLITEKAETLATKTGLNSEFATVIETAKNEWMIEANGNINKIPLIIHTDQHTNYSKPLWDTISGLVDWYDVGKVINLGDTVNAYVDSDAEHPYTKCADLENYIASMESVPYSKRIEIFGNHDTWQTVDGATVGITPHNYLNKYFRNIYARKADNYGNFVVYDNNYNVKYIAVSGFAYDSEKGGYSHYIIPSDSINWIISEMEKEDGYDVIILSHVPLNKVNWTSLNALWTSRKLKTSGSVTDEYGVVHDFDFTSCDGELLCGLHGHNHEDGCEYINDVLLSNWFDAYYISPRCIHFVLVDRENGQLNIWKVDDTPQYQNYQIPFNKPTE